MVGAFCRFLSRGDQWCPANDPESYGWRILAQQCQLGNLNGGTAHHRGKTGLQQREDVAAAIGGSNRSGQCHVKAKVLEHVGVAPAVEIFDLALAQSRAEPALAFLRTQPPPKRI